jgi:hypothetical protein
MSSLIPESPLVFSAQLAATIGLEEAILLQVIADASRLQEGDPFRLPVAALTERMPFWSRQDLQRVAKSLADKGVIEILCAPLTQVEQFSFRFDAPASTRKVPLRAPRRQVQGGANRISPYWQPDATVLEQLAQLGIPESFQQEQLPQFIRYWLDRNEVCHSWGARFLEQVTHKWQTRRHIPDAATTEPAAITPNWQPNADAMQILAFNGIPADFIEEAIPEFLLYWQERGEAVSSWNSKFTQHVKRQWARCTQALGQEGEPRPIPANWQPAPAFFEVLALANIDAGFARDCIGEFVLYWGERGEAHSAWNSKFLKHVKHCWAQKHLPRYTNEGQQNPAGRGAQESFVARHTDRGWREGL